MLFSEKLKQFEVAHPCENITVDGAQYRYILSGRDTDRTLVFLNGGMNTLEMWMDYVDGLSGDYRVLLFDYPQAHACLYELRLQLFIITVLHVPKQQRRNAVFLFQVFQRVCIHAAGGNENQSTGFSRILLHIDLRHHAAIAGTDKNRSFNAEFLKEPMHSSHKRLICAQLLGIIE